jgi:hypothetical protein
MSWATSTVAPSSCTASESAPCSAARSDAGLELDANTAKVQLAIEGHVLTTAELVGTSRRDTTGGSLRPEGENDLPARVSRLAQCVCPPDIG